MRLRCVIVGTPKQREVGIGRGAFFARKFVETWTHSCPGLHGRTAFRRLCHQGQGMRPGFASGRDFKFGIPDFGESDGEERCRAEARRYICRAMNDAGSLGSLRAGDFKFEISEYSVGAWPGSVLGEFAADSAAG